MVQSVSPRRASLRDRGQQAHVTTRRDTDVFKVTVTKEFADAQLVWKPTAQPHQQR